MELQVVTARSTPGRVPHALEVGGTQVPAVPVVEEQPLPSLLHVPLEVISDHGHQVGRDRDVPDAGARLRSVVGDQPFGPHDTARDVHHALGGVEVLATQLEDLPVPQGTPRAELDGEPQLVAYDATAADSGRLPCGVLERIPNVQAGWAATYDAMVSF